MEWQTIETAPKDRPVLVYGCEKNGNQAEFSQRICVAKYDHDMDLLSGIVPLFVYAEGHDDQLNRFIAPSHWMPLPEPPKKTPIPAKLKRVANILMPRIEPTTMTADELKNGLLLIAEEESQNE